MPHPFICETCGRVGECPHWACREVEGHRCELCHTTMPLVRPSGDVVKETAWPTRIGPPRSREA